jgi:ABC-type multidrug transport system fused ATPase/permease subunit
VARNFLRNLLGYRLGSIVGGKRRQFSDSFQVLECSQKKKFVLFVTLQTFATIGDLFGIFLIGLITSIAVSTLSDAGVNAFTVSILDFIGLKNYSFEDTVLILGLTTLIFFILKTIFSLIISKMVLKFLAKINISSTFEEFRRFTFSKSEMQTVYTQKDLEYAFNEGSQYAIIGVLGSFIALFSEFVSLSMIFIFLLIVSPYMSLWLLIALGIFGLVMNYSVGKRNARYSIAHSNINILGHELISDFFKIRRELYVSGKITKVLSFYKSNRKESAETNAQLLFYQIVPKLGLELLIVCSVAGLVILSVLESDFYTAISQVVIFFAALSRVAPSALRLQQAFFAIDYNFGHSGKYFEIFRFFRNVEPLPSSAVAALIPKDTIIIECNGLAFAYSNPSESKTILEKVNLTISQGEFIALVGPSGAGKSTLCDLILGVLIPTIGSIQINGTDARQFILANPGVIAFMPQSVNLIKGDIIRNVSLGETEYSVVEMNSALIRSGLGKLVQSNLKSQEEISSLSLSGGEIQRIGLARALVSNPKVLILDEPTSSLDQNNITLLSKTLQECNSAGTTLIVVAHQLSTIKLADRLVYIDDKIIKATGTFDELRQQIPDFERQAKLQRF